MCFVQRSLTLLCFLFLFLPAHSQNPSSRASAFGGASLCFADVWASNNNPAALCQLKQAVAATAFYNRFVMKELSTAAIALALPAGKGSWGFCYQRFGYSLYNENNIGLSYGLPLGAALSMGAAFRFSNIRQGDIYGTQHRLHAELSFLSYLNDRLSVGGRIKEISLNSFNKRKNQPYPSAIQLSGLYKVSAKVNLGLEVEKQVHSSLNWKTGIEYFFHSDFAVRAGCCTMPFSTSFGFGYKTKNVCIDLHNLYNFTLGVSSGISLSYHFQSSNGTK